MKKFLTLFVMVVAVLSAWAQETTAPFTFTSWTHDSWTRMSTKGSNVTSSIMDATEIHYSDKAFSSGSATFTIAYGGSGSRRGYVNGVELIQNGKVKYSTYSRKANNPSPHAVYTIDNIEAGTYTIKIWGSRNTDNEWINSTSNITVKQGNTTIVTQNGIAWTAWQTVGTNELSAGLKAVCTNVGTGMQDGQFKYKEETVTFKEACKGTVTYHYSGASGSGNERLDILGFEVLDENGTNVVYCDGHYGYTGAQESNNVYEYEIPAAGTYKVRTWIDGVRQPYSKGTVTYTYSRVSDDFNGNKVYVLDNVAGQRGKLAYNPSTTTYVDLADVTLAGGNPSYASLHANSADDAVGIYWQIKPQPDGTVQLYNLQNGKYANFTSNDVTCKWSDTGCNFTVEKTDGQYVFKLEGVKTTDIYLASTCGWRADQGAVRLDKRSVENHHKFTITEAPEVTFKTSTPASTFEGGLNGKSVGTFSSPYPVLLPDCVMAYTASVNGSTVNFTEFGRNIPRNVGVLLYAENGISYNNWPTTPAYTNVTVSNNALHAANGELAAGTYVLGNGSNGVGFYARVTPVTVANKAYLEVPAGSNLSTFRFDFIDTLTGIETIESEVSSAVVFDLQGRRVQNAKSGLYIVNGKKVIR